MQESQQQSRPQDLSVFNLTIEGFKQLHTFGIDLNHLFVLECLSEGTDIENHLNNSKIKAWKQNLYRKSLLTEDGKITTLGKELLSSLKNPLSSPRDVIKKSRTESLDTFEQWWKEYPPTDAIYINGKNMGGSRGLRQKKEECRKKFNDILLEGEHSPEDMIRALKREIFLKTQLSAKENENKLKYMQNSATYLNQRTFENFMYPKEDLKTTTPNTNPGAVDI